MNGILIGGRSMMRWLGSVFGAVGRDHGEGATFGLTSWTETGGIISPDRRIAGSPDRRIAGSPDRRSPDRRIAGSPDRRIAGSPDRRIAGSPDRRIAGSPDRRIALPASSARDCSRPLASPPESSASAGRRSDTRQPGSSSDSLDLSPARAAAVSHAVARRLRRGLAAGLLCLPLLLGLAAGAQAQTLSISAPTDANEGNSGTTDKFFTISLSSALTQNLSLKVCYTGTATRGASDDYQFLSGSVVINGSCSGFNISAGGTTSSTTGIRIRGDTAAEPDETVIATLSFTGSPPAGVVLGTSTATYTILDDDDTTAPGVTSIERHSPTTEATNADSLTWRVTFSEAVRNVDTTDFSLVILNTSTAFPQTTLAVSSVSTSVYDITASGNGPVHAEGHIQLVFASGHDIEDLSGNALPASPMVSGTNDNSFQLDNTAPTVTSITRQMPTTAMTDADSLTWRVTFDDAMQHVNAADFQVSGTTATITAVSPVTGSETTAYDVTATGGNLAGLNATVTLSFANTHNIEDEAGNRLASTTPTFGTNDNTFELQNVVIDPGAPQLVSIERHAQEVRNLGTSLVWRVSFDKHLRSVRESDFTLSGTTAGLDVRHDLSNYDPVTYKTSVLVIAQGGDLDTVSGTVTLNFASNHNIRDFEGRALASTTPTSGTNQNSFTLNPNETLVYFTQENYYVDEGDEAVVTLKLSRLRDTATTISAISATPLTATGNGVDFHGQTYSVTIPAWRASGTVNIRTSDDTLTEDEETFRIDIHTFNLPAGVVVGKAPGGALNAGQTYINIRDEDTATAKANKEPGLVFDNARLTWNEADGCDNTGPSYNVKLKNRPAGPVEVWIKDPDDDNRRGQNAFVANGRLYVANGPGLDETRTILRFTPGNWDKYQLVNVKVRCADHYTAQIPIKHRMYTNYTGDKGKLSHAYPGYVGVVDKGWTVHVTVRENNPPIVVKHLPAPGQPVDVKEGSHLDFEITLSNGAFEHDNSIPVYLSARGGKAAGVKRRDGDAQSCGGPFDDCLYFTPSNRTQWVRLFAINPGRDELKVEIPQIRWGNLVHGRDWEMRWPVAVIATGQGAPAENAAAPTQAVSRLQVTAIDALSASASWNAVEHARFYEVSWEAESSDQQTVITGIESVAGTSATIRHNAQEDMTLTVTVTPEYVDGNGVTQRMEALAATATLAIGPSAQSLGGDGGQVSAGEGGSRASALAACVSDALLADVDDRIANSGSPAGVERWTQVKNALTGQANAIALAEVQTIYDRRTRNGWSTSQWDPVIEAMECLENPPEEQPEQAEEKPVTPATPELSLRAGSAVDEGGNATFTVTADPAPATDLTIAWTVAQSGEYLAAPGAGSRTVTLTAGTASTDLSVATVDDTADEADGSVSVTLGAGTGYTVATGKGSAAVAVRDNDEPVVSIAAGSGVTEGASASFTVSASPVPAAPLDVTLSVGQSGDFAASGETGSRTVTVPVTGSATFEVATVDDGADEPDGSIAATLGTGTGYTVAAAPGNAATVAVSDNDAAASGPTISIADATFSENERYGYFTVTLSEKTDHDVRFAYATRDSTPVSATAGEDYVEIPRAWRIGSRIKAGKTQARFWIPIRNDSHDEDPETFEVELFDAFVWRSGKVPITIADGVAVGTIVNDDPMPAAWLARFGRTAAEQALDGIAGRIAASRSAGVQGTIAGQALNLDPGSGSGTGPGSQSGAANDNAAPGSLAGNDLLAQSDVARAFGASADGWGGGAIGHDAHGFATGSVSGAGGAGSYTMTGLEALLGSSFTATGEKDGMGGSLAFWGRAAQSSFDGREGTFSLDGEATSAMLGADYARGKWLAGLALMRSSGEGGYADRDSGPQHCPDVGEGMDADTMAHLCGGAVREGDGKVEASLTAAVPYAAIQASERLKLWGALGYGTGEVTLKPEVGGSLSSDISWTMAAAGMRNDLIPLSREGSGLALALTSDALWARTSSEKTHELAASESDVTRLRLGLEGSYRIATEGGGHLTPKLEIGARHDGGDAETGFGVELGGGLAWVDPGLGLSLDLSGRTLVAHGSDDLEDRGFAASLAFDPDPATARGPSLTLTQDWGGAAQGGLDALFASDPLADRTGGGEAAARWTAEAAWGFPAFSGRFTGSPHVGLGLATGARDYSLGWRFAPAANANAPDIAFGVKGMRRESGWAEPEHTLGLETTLRW